MTIQEFKDLYRQSLIEATQRWPEEYGDQWAGVSEGKLAAWVDKVIAGIPTNQIHMSGKKSSFSVFAKKLGIKQSVKAFQEALAACKDVQ